MIPIIDLGSARGGDHDQRARIAAEIGAACRDVGFFYVANHGIDEAAIARVFAQAKRFFDQPDAQKIAVTKRDGSNGYDPVEAQRLDHAAAADLKESFNFGRDDAGGEPGAQINRWPAQLPGFREEVTAYFETMSGLGLLLSQLIARSLSLAPNHFDAAFERHRARLRLLCYPPHPSTAAEQQFGAGAHTDWGWITLLAQDDCGGLEVRTDTGTWIRAEPVAGTFVVNCGDLVARWTNDRYHSNMHRVVNNRSGRNRYSVAFFYEPAYTTRVECLATCVDPGETPRYAPCSSGEHVEERRAASRAHAVP